MLKQNDIKSNQKTTIDNLHSQKQIGEQYMQ